VAKRVGDGDTRKTHGTGTTKRILFARIVKRCSVTRRYTSGWSGLNNEPKRKVKHEGSNMEVVHMKTGDVVMRTCGEAFTRVGDVPVYLAVVRKVYGDSEVELFGHEVRYAPTILTVLCSADGTGDCLALTTRRKVKE